MIRSYLSLTSVHVRIISNYLRNVNRHRFILFWLLSTFDYNWYLGLNLSKSLLNLSIFLIYLAHFYPWVLFFKLEKVGFQFAPRFIVDLPTNSTFDTSDHIHIVLLLKILKRAISITRWYPLCWFRLFIHIFFRLTLWQKIIFFIRIKICK